MMFALQLRTQRRQLSGDFTLYSCGGEDLAPGIALILGSDNDVRCQVTEFGRLASVCVILTTYMLDSLHSSLAYFATWPVVALLFILFLVCSQGFEWRRKTLGYENRALDGRFWYSPDDASDFLRNIGPDGRRIYAVTELTLDILFPLVYGTLFAALIIQVYAPESGKFLLLVPLFTAVFDVLENITTAYIAWRFDRAPSPITRVAATLTAVKSGLLILSLTLIVIGALIAASRMYRSRA